jgi:hypothetical protein
MGTWKLNTSQSKYSPGPAPKSSTQVYSQDGDWIVIKTESVDAAGKPVSTSNRYKRDGKEYPFQSPLAAGSGKITVKKIDDYHFEAAVTGEGGAHTSIRTSISKDGKTRTQRVTGVNAKGQKVNNVVVYDKQ